jgi:hypothetical protein
MKRQMLLRRMVMYFEAYQSRIPIPPLRNRPTKLCEPRSRSAMSSHNTSLPHLGAGAPFQMPWAGTSARQARPPFATLAERREGTARTKPWPEQTESPGRDTSSGSAC